MKITISDEDGTLLATARVGGISVNQAAGSLAINAIVTPSVRYDESGIGSISDSVAALIERLVRTGHADVGWPA